LYIGKVIKFLKFVFHISIFLLIVISLYPGSLFGYLFYGDLTQQPNIINNPIGTTINHLIYYFYVSILGLFLHLRNKNFNKILYGLLFLSVVLEVLQYIVPNRTFQLVDLIGNFMGVVIAYFFIKLYLFFNES
tara:strand:+ start:13 stop:411 length:399 start_codon:yes stop_codon:yes gene_type:complete